MYSMCVNTSFLCINNARKRMMIEGESMKIKTKELVYQGSKSKKPYFEGWYYKIATDDTTLSIIIGITKNTEDDHAFIQTLDTVSKETQYIRYSLNEVLFEDAPFHLQLKDNHFYEDRIIFYVNEQIEIDLIVHIDEFVQLKTTLYSPSIMGPFSYIPNMECIHSVCSLHHRVVGKLVINKKEISLQNAVGYIEKDRGISFPKEYLWVQSNHLLNDKKTSFFLSVANIPFKKFTFTGIIAVLFLNNEQLHFGTYYGAKLVSLKSINDKLYQLTIKQNKYKLEISIHVGEDFVLAAPKDAAMDVKVRESLDAKIAVQVYKGNELLEDLLFYQCGCEISGY